MKIGILGGTFDPIHLAHLAIGRAAYEEYGLDELWFMPAGNPYFKKGQKVTSPADRLRMTELALAGCGCPDCFKASDFEVSGSEDGRRTYTAETLEALAGLRPEARFYFIIGLDSLLALDSWYDTASILRHAVILYALRRGQMMSGKTAEAAVSYLYGKYAAERPEILRIHTPMIDISSTMVREMAERGEDIRHLVPEAVADYIAEHGLYHHI